jgi:uncharacterized protein (DUF433 family)
LALGWAVAVVAVMALLKVAIKGKHAWWRLILILLAIGAVVIAAIFVLGPGGVQLEHHIGATLPGYSQSASVRRGPTRWRREACGPVPGGRQIGHLGREIVERRGAACHTSRVSVAILEREMYTEAAAARLLRVAPSTLHWWLEGRPPRYRPVIRIEPTGSRHVTWAEFVEASLLRSYRREHDVPLRELREFIDRLRDEFQVPYPLADRRPYVGPGRQLLIDLQGRSHLDPEFCLVAVANGQIVLTAPGEEFFERVDWSGDQPASWHPHQDPESPIRVNPLVRFGMPAVRGISTEAIAGELDGGASLEEVAEDFGLDIDAVRWAQSYELSQHAAA